MSALVFETPPPNGAGRPPAQPWIDVASALRGRPGEWAKIGDDLTASTVRSIKNGRLVAFKPAGSFEAVCRGVSKGRCSIWARYIGETES